MKSNLQENISKTAKISLTHLNKGVKIIKNKKQIVIPLAFVSIFLIAIILLLVFSPVIHSKSLPYPQISNETRVNTLTNSSSFNISIENNNGIFVEYNGVKYASSASRIDINNVEEGEQVFKIRTMKNYYLFKLVSTEYETFYAKFDYTNPYFNEGSIEGIEDEYYSKTNYIKFETDEEYISIYSQVNGENVLTYSDELSSEDTPDPNDENQLACNINDTTVNVSDEEKNEPEVSSLRKFTCPIKFSDEGEYQISIFVEDRAGNKNYIMENKKVMFVEPIKLDCGEVPDGTNKSSIDLSCVPSKSGSYIIYEKTVQIESGKAFALKLDLTEEGENDIPLILKDNDGREFTHNFTIIRDTTDPQLNNLSYTDPVAWHKTLSISFDSNEAITGTITVTPYQHSCGYWNVKGAFSKNFSLNKNEKFSTAVNTSGFKTCSDFNDEVCVSPLFLIIDITYKDKAGNTAKINSKGVEPTCTGEYCDTYWPIR